MKVRWIVGGATIAALAAYCMWLVLTDAPAYQFLVRLYVDKRFLKHTLREWGVLAPVIFILLQARQVIIAPIPGELTGILGGYLFGEWVGLLYSTIGLTLGSVAAFAVGRWLGAHYVRKLVSPDTWNRMGFIVEAEGAILCFLIFLVPGLPKDMTCYLFGLSPMPFWVFAIVSTVGRVPGTWVLSAQGAHTASGDYLQLILLTALFVAVALPLYYYRNRLVQWFRGKRVRRLVTLANETNPGNGAIGLGLSGRVCAPRPLWLSRTLIETVGRKDVRICLPLSAGEERSDPAPARSIAFASERGWVVATPFSLWDARPDTSPRDSLHRPVPRAARKRSGEGKRGWSVLSFAELGGVYRAPRSRRR